MGLSVATFSRGGAGHFAVPLLNATGVQENRPGEGVREGKKGKENGVLCMFFWVTCNNGEY